MFDQETIPAPVEVEAVKETAEATQLAHRFDSYAIVAAEQYESAALDLKAIKAKAKDLDEMRKSLTRPLDDSKKRIVDLFAKPLDALAKAEGIIKSAMLTWQREQERIRHAEEARLRELQRQVEDRLRKEQERLQAQAEAAAEKGKIGKAELIQKTAEVYAQKAEEVAAAVIVVAPTVQKVSGISTRLVWKYRIIDETKIPREYLMVDEVKLGKLARSMNGTVRVDGVEFYAESGISAGR